MFSSIVPCEKLTLKTLTPISESFLIELELEVEGPIVHIILIFILVLSYAMVFKIVLI
jgi:hypothetical protein